MSFSVPYEPTEYTAQSIQPVLKSLEENTQNISEIHIKSTYTEESLSLLTDMIQECQNLTYADFSQSIHESASAEMLETLNTTLLCLRSLYEVNLSNNNLSEESIDTLSFLFHSENLKILKINDNYLGVEGAVKLAEVFRNSELQLYVFCAERNYLEN